MIRAKTPAKEELWLTNISKRDVSLGDLNFTIRSRTSINILDSKHYHLAKDQILASIASGSIFNKRNMVIVRKVAPVPFEAFKKEMPQNTFISTKNRSGVVVEEIKYEELDLPDEKFAEENTEIAQRDHLGRFNK